MCVVALVGVMVEASSHSEAPGTATSPRSDLVDFYAFSSYETGRSGYVTLLANVNPLQETFGGPNYSPLPSDFVFNIHVDNTGDAIEDMTFQFIPGANFSGAFVNGRHEGLRIPVGGRMIKVPLAHIGVVTSAADEGVLNYKEHYQLRVFTGPASSNSMVDAGPFVTNSRTNTRFFRKPFDYAGTKSFPMYETYARSFIYNFAVPGCAAVTDNKGWVGQRKEPFAVNLGQVFDLLFMVPVQDAPFNGVNDPARNVLQNKAVTTFALEISKTCIRGAAPNNKVIGTWASVQHLAHDATGAHIAGAQKNRLGNPLVNELLIGITDKDTFNLNHPSRDSQFREYFEYPTVPELVEILWGNGVRGAVPSVTGTIAPTFFPRADILTVLLQGVPTLNQFNASNGDATCNPPIVALTPGPLADVLRLNLDVAVTAQAAQDPIGPISNDAPLTDAAGYPNGRRPGDDVVDIIMRAAMGRLCHPPFDGAFGICTPAQAAVGGFRISDRAPITAMDFDAVFPYFKTPVPGNQIPGAGAPTP